MKYYLYYSPITKSKRIIDVELKKPRKNAKRIITEDDWYNFMVCGTLIKSSENLEDLFDAFVIKIKTGYLIIDHYDKKLLEQDATQNGADVYGAIWTDKGLKYFAKIKDITDDGKIVWELLY